MTHFMPEPFQTDRDTGAKPEGTDCAFHFPHYIQVADAVGRRFRIMGYGPMQGTVMLRDSRRRTFCAEGAQLLRPVDARFRP